MHVIHSNYDMQLQSNGWDAKPDIYVTHRSPWNFEVYISGRPSFYASNILQSRGWVTHLILGGSLGGRIYLSHWPFLFVSPFFNTML